MTEPTATTAPAANDNAPAEAAEPTMGDAILSAAKEAGMLPSEPANTQEAPKDGAPANDNGEAKPEAEKPPEEPKHKDTALFRAALKAREEATRIREEGQRAKAEADATRSEVEKLKAELTAEREKYGAIKSDPFKFFELFGVDPNAFARHLMTWNEKAPELREADAKLETMAQRVERLEKERAAFEAKAKADAEQAQAAQLAANVKGAKENFWKHVESNAKTYPNLAVGDSEDVAEVFWDLARRHYDNTGTPPTFDMVAAHLENVAAEKAARVEARRKQLFAPAVSETVSETPRQTSPSANGAPPRSPTTLTNAASVRASPPQQATPEEVDRWAVELLRKSFG